MHGFVREGRRGVRGAEEEVVLLGGSVPPVVPGCAEGFALGDELPLLNGGLGAEGAD